MEELKNVPSSSEKNISDATSKKELLEKAKDKEEEKLKQVMSSLQEETREIQKEKEVDLYAFCFNRGAAFGVRNGRITR